MEFAKQTVRLKRLGDLFDRVDSIEKELNNRKS